MDGGVGAADAAIGATRCAPREEVVWGGQHVWLWEVQVGMTAVKQEWRGDRDGLRVGKSDGRTTGVMGEGERLEPLVSEGW